MVKYHILQIWYFDFLYPTDPQLSRKKRWARVPCQKSGSERGGHWRTGPGWQRQTLLVCNITMLRGKESELHVWEVEHYRLYLVGLTYMHSVRTGTKLLDWGLTLFFAETAQGVSCQAGLGVLTSPRLSIAALEFIFGGREACLPTP